jgi:hypothetical protein
MFLVVAIGAPVCGKHAVTAVAPLHLPQQHNARPSTVCLHRLCATSTSTPTPHQHSQHPPPYI